MALQPKLEQRLRELSHEEVIEVLLAVADTNASVRKMITGMTATVKEQVSTVKKELKKLTQRPTSRRRVMPREIADDLTNIVMLIERISHQSPSTAFSLLCAVICAEEDIHAYVHDSYGTISDAYHSDVVPMLILMVQKINDANTLLDGLRIMCANDPFGTVSRIMKSIADMLPEEVTTVLLAEVKNVHVSKAIYRGIGDIPNFIRVITSTRELISSDFVEIADMYLDHDDLKGAQQYVDKFTELDREGSIRGREVYERYVMHTKDPVQIEAFMRTRMVQHPSPENVDAYRTRFGEDATSKAIDVVVQRMATSASTEIHSSTPFLAMVREGRSADAAAIIESGTISPFGYYRPWGELVVALAEHGYHRAASLIVRIFLEYIMQSAKSQYYDEAARLYRLLDELAVSVTDWGTHEEHDAYMALFADRHERKWKFWERFVG